MPLSHPRFSWIILPAIMAGVFVLSAHLLGAEAAYLLGFGI